MKKYVTKEIILFLMSLGITLLFLQGFLRQEIRMEFTMDYVYFCIVFTAMVLWLALLGVWIYRNQIKNGKNEE